MRRGLFFLFEGVDRSGKTTQVDLLFRHFESLDQKAQKFRFPLRSTLVGKTIDGYLKSEIEVEDHAIHLLFSANRWEMAAEIEKTLKSGVHIIMDRYVYSGIVR